jgi:hypothetical protein
MRFAVPPSPSVQAVPPLLGPRLRTKEWDLSREREGESKRKGFPIPIDLSGKLSAPFLLGKRSAPRSSSRSGNGYVRWKDLDGAELFRRSEDDSESRRGSREERSDRESYKRRERERDRDRDREVRPKLHTRRSSHEDLRRERERDREREAGDGRSFRERERDSERRLANDFRRGDARRYPSH